MESTGGIADDLLKAFSAADIEAMRSMLAEDLVAFITNAEGGLDRIEGREEYLSRIEAMDLPSARFSVELTQAPVPVDSDEVLVMVEVRAQRGGRTLHNFAAHLLRVAGGRVTEWRMVEAKPADSDEFWS
jgi:ketosteroid isomerase-like protein